jgi:hypothetical protein
VFDALRVTASWCAISVHNRARFDIILHNVR